MAKRTLHPIKVSHFDADAIRRQKGANRRAIAAATPEQREAMQRAYSLFGYNRADITLDESSISKSLLLARTGSLSAGKVASVKSVKEALRSIQGFEEDQVVD